jgi:hypothetical protein
VYQQHHENLKAGMVDNFYHCHSFATPIQPTLRFIIQPQKERIAYAFFVIDRGT